MATPKIKVSHRRSHMRLAHWLGSLRAPGVTVCPHCGEPIMTYRACPACGWYRGRKVMNVATAEAATESAE